MGRPPAFQLYVKDWLTSKKRAAMGLDQQAAYMNLLCHCWDTDDCSLPDDPAILASLSELREHWNTRSTLVQQAFEQHPNKPGFITNMRLYAEHQKYRQIQKERRRAGRQSGASRRKGKANNTEQVFSKCSASVEQLPNSSIPSSSSISEKKKRENSGGIPSLTLSPEEIQNRWNTIPGVKPCKALGTTIRERVRTRLREQPDPSWWNTLLQRIQAADFLCGRTNGGKGPFHASLDWVLRPTNLDKILAGDYDAITSNGHAKPLTCTKRIQVNGDRFLHECGQPASSQSRPNEPRCSEHLTPVRPLQGVATC
jgi:uncharacterized protein YdaU (DUF1376 family)